jgi:hypothetical protein
MDFTTVVHPTLVNPVVRPIVPWKKLAKNPARGRIKSALAKPRISLVAGFTRKNLRDSFTFIWVNYSISLT